MVHTEFSGKGRETFGEVRVRRHPRGGGVYVYIPEVLLERTKIPRDQETLLVTRYGTKSGEIILRFRAHDPTEWEMDHEYVTRPRRNPAPIPPETGSPVVGIKVSTSSIETTPPPRVPVETAEEVTRAAT